MRRRFVRHASWGDSLPDEWASGYETGQRVGAQVPAAAEPGSGLAQMFPFSQDPPTVPDWPHVRQTPVLPLEETHTSVADGQAPPSSRSQEHPPPGRSAGHWPGSAVH